jgi:hypothetical protein
MRKKTSENPSVPVLWVGDEIYYEKFTELPQKILRSVPVHVGVKVIQISCFPTFSLQSTKKLQKILAEQCQTGSKILDHLRSFCSISIATFPQVIEKITNTQNL